MGRLSTAERSALPWNRQLLNRPPPRPFYGLCHHNPAAAPQYSEYFVLPTLRFARPVSQGARRYNGVRELSLHSSVFHLTVVAEVPGAFQEILRKARSPNAPSTLGTCVQSPFVPCPWAQAIPVTVPSKCITFWQKGSQLTLFTVFYHVAHIRLHSGFCVFV